MKEQVKDSAKVEILFEDANLLVVNKPAGLVVHADGRTDEKTLVDWILSYYPALRGIGEPTTLSDGRVIDRPGIVHRIDRETSGALVVAKTPEAFEYLKKLFQDRKVRKVYRTFVWGEIKEPEGTIDRPIGKSKTDFRRWSAERGAKGELREALTYFNVLKRGLAAVPDAASRGLKDMEMFTYVEAQPKTGRTHQIRVHMKAVQHPVVGDILYAQKRPYALGFNRVALHAYSIEFKNMDGKTISVTAPLPSDFLAAEKQLC